MKSQCDICQWCTGDAPANYIVDGRKVVDITNT